MAAHYLTKKDLLRELQKSKITYCSFLEPRYANQHCIVRSIEEITPELIEQIVHDKANPRGRKEPELIEPKDVVVRCMTYDHIPLDPERKSRLRHTDKPYAKVPFPPFKHYVFDGEPKEVGRSHWQNGFINGSFSPNHGQMTDSLARMFMLLVDRIASRSNWRYYSYADEFRANAILQLCQVGLMFDESKSDNPFAFYTTTVNHSFTRTLNIEKKGQAIRDDLLELNDATPSHTRQDQELDAKFPKLPPISRKKKVKDA